MGDVGGEAGVFGDGAGAVEAAGAVIEPVADALFNQRHMLVAPALFRFFEVGLLERTIGRRIVHRC